MKLFSKYGTLCEHCNRNCLLPYEYEYTCIVCGYNVIKRKNELSKIARKKNVINRLKYAEHKIFCICIDGCKIYERKDFNKISGALSKLKNKKLKFSNILIERYKDMNENPGFKQEY